MKMIDIDVKHILLFITCKIFYVVIVVRLLFIFINNLIKLKHEVLV